MPAADGSATHVDEPLRELAALLPAIGGFLEHRPLHSKELLPLLSRLKELTRNPCCTELLSSKESIQNISRIARSSASDDASREALRCLANILFLRPAARQTFVDQGHAGAIAQKLNTDRMDNEFLCCRILFLLTYDTTLDFADLVGKYTLAKNISECLTRHAERFSKDRDTKPKLQNGDAEMALCEILKLLFNISHNFPNLAGSFTPCVVSVTSILRHSTPLPEPPLQPPISLLINALLNLDLQGNGQGAFFPPLNPVSNVQTIITILENATTQYKPKELDDIGAPILTLMRRIFESAPDDVRQSIQFLLLPSNADRARPLGSSDTLSSRLLKLSTSAHASRLRDSISSFFFELSDKNPGTFVRNVGYGYASGFLANNNMPVPIANGKHSTANNYPRAKMSSAGSSLDVDARSSVNFVTGQFLDQEPKLETAPMSEDEKLREAEKLFVLFERLKRTGVVDVQNPVQIAIDRGRFEEVD